MAKAERNPADYQITINGYAINHVVSWDEKAGTILVNLPDGTQETKSGSVAAKLWTEIEAEERAVAKAVEKRQADEAAAKKAEEAAAAKKPKDEAADLV